MRIDCDDWTDFEEWDDEVRPAWLACPDANPQRVRRALGFWERSVRELELRVPLGGNDGGVCRVFVDERDDEVHVRVLVCYDDYKSVPFAREYIDCPVRVWLERPLGERAVIDIDSDKELPLFTPAYLDNVPQPDHGYRPANRRHRKPKRR
jgi:hypothetical protein